MIKDYSDLIKKLDEAYYSSKYAGNNCVFKVSARNRRIYKRFHFWTNLEAFGGMSVSYLGYPLVYDSEISNDCVRFETNQNAITPPVSVP